MARINLEPYRKNRMMALMNEFLKYEKLARELIEDGGNFLDVHEWHMKAAMIIHIIDEEKLLDMAKDMYSWAATTIDDYLDVYDEIQSEVRI